MEEVKKVEELKLDEGEIKEGAPFAALSYVFCLWILTFIFKKDNRFAHFHARQGIVVFITGVVFWALSLIPLIGVVFYVTGLIIFLSFSLYGIYSSLTGKCKRMPIVGDIAEKLVI